MISDSSSRSGMIRAPLGRSLGPYSITLTQQKLECGANDSECVCEIKVCSIPEIFLYCLCTKEYC